MRIECQGEVLELLADRAVHWPRMNMLTVTDTHFGKAATFRSAGIPVPEQTTSEDLHRLTKLLELTNATHLMVLGDLIHAKKGKSIDVVRAVGEWRQRHSDIRVTLIRGNHDRSAGALPEDWRIEMHPSSLAMPPFLFSHEPHEDQDLYVMSGHIHPSVSISDGLHRRVRVACFSFGERYAILPAFGSFTGTYELKPVPSDRIFVIAENEVIEIPHAAIARGGFRNG